MPMNTVSSRKGFVAMIEKLDPRYRIPSQNYFSQAAIPQMYDEWRKTVKPELSQVEYYASTTDLWSSCTTEPHRSFTVHFLTEDFKLKTRCLETVYFAESHTGENIAIGLRVSQLEFTWRPASVYNHSYTNKLLINPKCGTALHPKVALFKKIWTSLISPYEIDLDSKFFHHINL